MTEPGKTAPAEPWPTEISLAKSKMDLSIAFDDGAKFTIPAELLRVMSPSAEVQGHSASQRVTVPGKANVKIAAVEPIGNYAVLIRFDDGHATGFYRWSYLYDLGARYETHWQTYLDELAAKGLGRR